MLTVKYCVVLFLTFIPYSPVLCSRGKRADGVRRGLVVGPDLLKQRVGPLALPAAQRFGEPGARIRKAAEAQVLADALDGVRRAERLRVIARFHGTAQQAETPVV